MADVRIAAHIQMYNEASRGNLKRCLDNACRWADDIAIYDDASTDASVDTAYGYTRHVIRGKVNDFYDELAHKQQLLDYILNVLNPDWVFTMDCDEIIDREHTNGALRELCKRSQDVEAFAVHNVNLWRGQSWARKDGLFDAGWFVKLWNVRLLRKKYGNVSIKYERGLHHRAHPIEIQSFLHSDIRMIHYGFSDYAALMSRWGLADMTREEFIAHAETSRFWNEEHLEVYKVPLEWFPKDNAPKEESPRPEPKPLESLKAHKELMDDA